MNTLRQIKVIYYEASIELTKEARKLLCWWANNIHLLAKPMLVKDVDIEIFTDASMIGWGARMGEQTTGGQWAEDELAHINLLELRAAFLAVQSFCQSLSNIHIKICSDNTTTVACINKAGSTKRHLHSLTCEFLTWASARDIIISAAHIPGVENIDADRESRHNNVDTEWMLLPKLFTAVCQYFHFTPSIDLFATRINAQLPQCFLAPRPTCRRNRCFTIIMVEIHSILFSSFQHFGACAEEDQNSANLSFDYHAPVANQALVCDSITNGRRTANFVAKEVPQTTTRSRETTSACTQASPGSHDSIRTTFQGRGIPEDIAKFLMCSWRTGTRTQYRHYLDRWMLFCKRRSADPLQPLIADVLAFLFDLFHNGKTDGSGLSYSALGTAGSAISTIAFVDNTPAGQHPLVKQFMRAVYNLRPSFPKTGVTWDPQVVLTYLKTLVPVRKLSLKMLSHKLTMLLLLLTGQRGQSIHSLDIVNMTISTSSVSFRIADILKTSRPTSHTSEIKLN